MNSPHSGEKVKLASGFIGVKGALFAFNPNTLKKSLVPSFEGLSFDLQVLGVQLSTGTRQTAFGLSPSILLGSLLIIAIMGLVLWRIRWRWTHSLALKADLCPRCGASIYRIHRSPIEHLLSKTLLPDARRYHCSNSTCSWKGLRKRRHHDSARHNEPDVESDRA